MRTKQKIARRSFLKSCAAFGCGLGAPILAAANAQTEDVSQAETGPNIIGPREGFSPHLGTLASMLTWMRGPVLSSVHGLTVAQLDYLHDAKANTIGALLLHLAATERHYQIHTFEGKKWGDWDEPTRKQWGPAGGLGGEARKKIKGNDLPYYLAALEKIRAQTLAELARRDDAWLMEIDRDWVWGPTNNYCKWFHVCEHESNHNGQIKWIKSRLPGAKVDQD